MEPNALARLKRVAGKQTTTLTHYGRKTGKPHDVTIWFVFGRRLAFHRHRKREPPMGAQRPEDSGGQVIHGR